MTTVDVVIAGGGLIGTAIAWRCVQRGLSVIVVDPSPGAGASHAAGGMLAPVTEATYGEERLLRLCQESLRRFPGFVAELEAATGMTWVCVRAEPCWSVSMLTTCGPWTTCTASTGNSGCPRRA